MKIIPWLLLIIAVLLEGSVTTIPLTINSIIILYVITRSNFLFGLASILGIFLDLMSVRTVGISSLLFFLLFFLIIIYERKFEIQTTPFIFFSSFIATSIMFITNYHYFFILQVLSTAILTTFVFKIVYSSDKRTNVLA